MKTLKYLLISLSVVICGCNFTVSKGRADKVNDSEEFKEGLSLMNRNKYDVAIDKLKIAAFKYPNSAMPLLQIGICCEKMGDYPGVIYNFNEFLRISAANYKENAIKQTEIAKSKGEEFDATGKDKRKVEGYDEISLCANISNRIENAKQLYTQELVGRISSGSADERVLLVDELAKEKKKNEELIEKNQKLKNEILEKDKLIQSQKSTITRYKLQISEMSSSPDGRGHVAGIVNQEKVKNDDGTIEIVQTYEVLKGDTLSKIALRAYGDAKKIQPIKDANPDKIRGSNVKVGDILIIP